MYGVLDRISGVAGEDRQERLHYDLNAMFARERTTALGEAYRYWLSIRTGRDIPHERDFDPQRCPSSGSVAAIPWIDARAEDPFDFRFHDHPAKTFCDFSGRRLAEYPSRMHVEACAREYILCRALRVPMYHEIDQTIGGRSRTYRRLLLPVADASGRVGRLYYAVALMSFGDNRSAHS